MTVYAVTYQTGVSPNITPGNRYEVEESWSEGFDIRFDNGKLNFCLWDGCAHLGGGSWIRIEEDDDMKAFNIGDKVFANGWRNDTDDHDHEFGANSTIEKWVRDKTELTVMEGPNRRNVCKVTDGDSRYWLHISEIDHMAERITLQPGDYISTKGLTEDDYHAVARAFEMAGCPRFGGIGAGKGSGDFLEWYQGELVSTSVPEEGGRHLTPQQVVNAANATKQEESTMTPCEKLGYKVGDKFITHKASTFSDGSIVELFRDDGTQCPLFKPISGLCNHRCLPNGEPGAYASINFVKPIATTIPDPLTTILEQAAEHDATAKHHAAMHERLMAEARDMLPEGWRLVRDGINPADGNVQTVTLSEDVSLGEDMSDPANWREGDVVECLEKSYIGYGYGKKYRVSKTQYDGKRIGVIDDEGRDQFRLCRNFRFAYRP